MKNYRRILEELKIPDGIIPFSEDEKELIIHQLLNKAEIPVDSEKLESKISRMMAAENHNMQYALLNDGDYSIFLPEKRQARQMKIRKETEQELKTDTLLRFIAESEHITVTLEELETEARRIAAENSVSIKDVQQFMGCSFELLYDDLILRKTIFWLCNFMHNSIKRLINHPV